MEEREGGEGETEIGGSDDAVWSRGGWSTGVRPESLMMNRSKKARDQGPLGHSASMNCLPVLPESYILNNKSRDSVRYLNILLFDLAFLLLTFFFL